MAIKASCGSKSHPAASCEKSNALGIAALLSQTLRPFYWSRRSRMTLLKSVRHDAFEPVLSATPQPSSVGSLSAVVMVVAALGFLVYFPFLGYSGLSLSEGHRAIPGWQMLASGEWFPTKLFEYPYLRKPPGMPWAVAFFSAFLGQTAFSARAVSALATVVAACASAACGVRWFGPRAGLVSGVVYLLTPLFWYPGRSAEIEAFHNVWVLLSTLLIIAILRAAAQTPRVNLLIAAGMSIALGGSLAMMMLAKGPAGAIVPIVALAIGCKLLRPRTVLWLPAIFASVAIATGIMLVVMVKTVASLSGLPRALLQPPSHFLWNPTKALDVLFLPVSALVSSLPTCVGIFIFARFTPLSPGPAIARATARTLAYTCVLSIIAYMIAGVANSRYAMPPLTLCPLVLAASYFRWRHAASTRFKHREHLRSWAFPVIAGMLALAAAHHTWLEYRRSQLTSGQREGERLGSLLPDHATVYAFEIIDQRPEILWYAQRAAADLGKTIYIEWRPYPAVFGQEGPPALPRSGDYVLLRTDDLPRDQYPPEVSQYVAAGFMPMLREVTSGRVHKFTFTLFRYQGS